MWTEANLVSRYLGITQYAATRDLQLKLINSLIDDVKKDLPGNETLLLTQHFPVITLGRHANPGNLLFDEDALAAKGVELHRIERGGDVTFHGPGQLVAYPIIYLRNHNLGVKDYVNLLEETVIRLIAEYGIRGERVEGASGVWIGKGSPNERKIAAVGVKCSRFVTMHGIALNVSTDMTGFRLINPCGFIDKGVTSILCETGESPDIEEVAQRFDRIFRHLLTERKA